MNRRFFVLDGEETSERFCVPILILKNYLIIKTDGEEVLLVTSFCLSQPTGHHYNRKKDNSMI
jgi:hypothetical protein